MSRLARYALWLFAAVVLAASPASAQPKDGTLLRFEPGDTLEEIRAKIAHNGYNFTVAPNWVSEMPPEFAEGFLSRRAPLVPSELSDDIGPLARHLGKTALPPTFDWRSHHGRSYIGPIRNQGACGACYAFGACAAAEGAYNWANGLYDGSCADFSEAFVAFCLSDYYSGFDGCSGSDYDYEELNGLVDHGVCDDSAYPYADGEQPCRQSASAAPRVRFSSWHRVLPCNDIDAIKTAIMTYGVVDAAVYVGSTSSVFASYSGGVYQDLNTACDGTPCSYTPTDHAVALVGWDDNPPDGGGGYWILRNSWGESWGENGYMRIRYNSARVACEVAYLSGPYAYTPPAPTPGPVAVVRPGEWLTVTVSAPPLADHYAGYYGYSTVTLPTGGVLTVFNSAISPYAGPLVFVGGLPYGYTGYIYNGPVPLGAPLGDCLFETALIQADLYQSFSNATYYGSCTARIVP